MRGAGRTPVGAMSSRFPLSISGRYLVSASGQPFFISGDTGWSLEVQCSFAQIDQYLNHRRSAGFTAIVFECIEHKFSSQSPAYRNQAGLDPFTTMSPVAWTSPTDAYWRYVDYIVNGCLARGMVAMLCPAYLGFGGGTEGWMTDVTAASAGDLQTYGAWLARRYTQPNVIWVLGGDYAGDTTQRNKQWNIVTGMRTVRTTDLITGHPARTDATAYGSWNGYTGFNVNVSYVPTTNIADDRAATAYSQGLPFFTIEGGYEGESGTAASIRMGAYTTVLSGGIGYVFGNNPLWGFGEPNSNGGAGAAAALVGSLHTAGAVAMGIFANFFAGYEWWRLIPKTDTSLVTTSLGTSGTTGRVCPALADNGRFAMIWTPTVNVTVDMTKLTIPSVRGRWFDPSTGTWSTASGSPFANTGTQSFTAPGDRVLVLDPP